MSYVSYNDISLRLETILRHFDSKKYGTLRIGSHLGCTGYYILQALSLTNLLRIPCNQSFPNSLAVCEKKFPKKHVEKQRMFTNGFEIENRTLHPHLCREKISKIIYNCLKWKRNQNICLKRIRLGRSCVDSVMYEYKLCRRNQIQCTNGECIADKYVCDGKTHCLDNTDEINCLRTNICTSFTMKLTVVYCLTSCKASNHCECSKSYFQCVSGGCIPVNKLCDRIVDCQDSSDEHICSYPQCKVDEFRCDNHRCVALLLVCNSFNDCFDSSDENNCTAIHYHSILSDLSKYDGFKCGHNFKYMDRKWICILTYDRYGVIRGCPNGKHLEQCESHRCVKHYKCHNSYCIPVHYICDGKVDCPDEDDENMCHKYTCPGLFRCNRGMY